MAQSPARGPISFRGGSGPGRSDAAQGGRGNGARVFAGRSSPGAIDAPGDAYHLQLPRSSFPHTAYGMGASVRSAQRLGTGSGESAAAVLTTAPGTAGRNAHRPSV